MYFAYPILTRYNLRGVSPHFYHHHKGITNIQSSTPKKTRKSPNEPVTGDKEKSSRNIYIKYKDKKFCTEISTNLFLSLCFFLFDRPLSVALPPIDET